MHGIEDLSTAPDAENLTPEEIAERRRQYEEGHTLEIREPDAPLPVPSRIKLPPGKVDPLKWIRVPPILPNN